MIKRCQHVHEPLEPALTGLKRMEFSGVCLKNCSFPLRLIMPKLNKDNVLLLYLSPSCLESVDDDSKP